MTGNEENIKQGVEFDMSKIKSEKPKIIYKAAKYIRLSHADDDKKDESDSVSNQRKIIDSYIGSQPDIEAVSEMVDDGYTGIIFDRPAFKEMMLAIEEGKINCVIVKDLSRFGREFTETGRYLRNILPAYGVRFIALLDNIDTLKDSSDDLIVSVKTLMNDAYCRDISIKTRSTLNSKRKNGDYVGNFTAYGYIKSKDNHNQLIIDKCAADVVKDIYRMRIEGMSAFKIADTLNCLGVLSPLQYKKDRGIPHSRNGYTDKSDAKWSATTIIRILKDETYTGTLIQGKQSTPNYKIKQMQFKPMSEWRRVENTHDPIIEKEDYDLVQRIMRLDTRTGPKNDNNPKENKVFPFSGILICGSCGARMTRKTNTVKGKSYHYYYCPTGKKNGCVKASMLKESDLSESIFGCIKTHISSIVSIETMLEGNSKQKALNILAEKVDVQISENEYQLKEIRRYKSKLHENLMNGLIDSKEFKDMKASYITEEKRYIDANDLLKQEREDILAGKSEKLGWMGHFKKYEHYTELDRCLVISFIQSIHVLSKTELKIKFNYQNEFNRASAVLHKKEAA